MSVIESSGIIEYQDEDVIHDQCGVTGIYSPNFTKQFPFGVKASEALQPRGQQGFGFSLKAQNQIERYVGNGLVREVVTPEIAQKYEDILSRWSVFQTRYGTSGGYQVGNLQPCFAFSPDGTRIDIIENGQLVAMHKMRTFLKSRVPEDASDTFMFAQMVAQMPGENWDEKVIKSLDLIDGAYNLMIGVEDKLYVARDQRGFKPLVRGHKGDMQIVTSEDFALRKIGATLERAVRRGEVYRYGKDGVKTLKEGFEGSGNFCDFEPTYLMFPHSRFPTFEQQDDYKHPEKWLTVASFRERCGELVASQLPVRDISFVCGIPDSGVPGGIGVAKGLNALYRQAVIRDHYDPNGDKRLFQQDNDLDSIEAKVIGKLSLVPDPQVWEGAVVVFCDDSLVRAKVAPQITNAAYAFGAEQVHWAFMVAPIRYTCHLGVSTRTNKELAASPYNFENYSFNAFDSNPPQLIVPGASSVTYISHHDFLKAGFKDASKEVVVPRNPREIYLENGRCGGCLTGLYPVNENGDVYESVSPKQLISIG